MAAVESLPVRRDGGRMRVPELDLLRFIAALAVVFYHYTYRLRLNGSIEDPYPALGRATLHGYLGVELFFMISGFVVLWSAIGKRPSEFVVSRATRLYPEFWIGVVVSAIVFSLAGQIAGGVGLPMLIANLTMVPHLFGFGYVDGVYWTLFVELKFYFLIWILLLTGQIRHVETWVRVWFVATVACFVLPMPGVLRSITMVPFAPLFIAGCVFYLVRSQRLTPSRAAMIVGCGIMSVVHVLDAMPEFVHDSDIHLATRIEASAIIVAMFLTFSWISIYPRERSTGKLIVWLGMLTYPLYLLHNAGKVTIMRPFAGEHRVLALVAALTLSLLLSATVVLLVEKRRKQLTLLLQGHYSRIRNEAALRFAPQRGSRPAGD